LNDCITIVKEIIYWCLLTVNLKGCAWFGGIKFFYWNLLWILGNNLHNLLKNFSIEFLKHSYRDS
jgi:hypothetical protein